MKENDVAYIVEQFGIEKEIVEASVTDGTLGVRIKDALSSKKIYTDDELKALEKNLKAEAQNSYFTDLVEKAKKGDVPTELYKPIKGAAYQQLERDFAKKFDIAEFDDLNDLVSKAVQKQSANGNISADVEAKIKELKEANIRLNDEKNNALQQAESKFKNTFIEREKADTLKTIPFDFSDVKPDEIDKVAEKTRTLLKSVFDSQYKIDYSDDKFLVLDTKGDVVKNQVTRDPLSMSDVMVSLAKEYNLKMKSSDSGGQGGKSSGQSNAPFTSADEFFDWAKSQNINPMSKEAIDIWKKSGVK